MRGCTGWSIRGVIWGAECISLSYLWGAPKEDNGAGCSCPREEERYFKPQNDLLEDKNTHERERRSWWFKNIILQSKNTLVGLKLLEVLAMSSYVQVVIIIIWCNINTGCTFDPGATTSSN